MYDCLDLCKWIVIYCGLEVPNIIAALWGPLAQSVERRASGREIRGSGLSRVGGGFHMYS